MLYYYNTSTDPYYNLAFEEYVFTHAKPEDTIFLLWQNKNTIVIGRNQNTIAEINTDFVKKMDTQVVRRITGGGAVYHDMGNVNFTFIQGKGDSEELDFSKFGIPVIQALAKIGVKAELSGRNDMTIEGKKFSGAAQTVRDGKILHHGTLLFDSDLSFLGQALTVRPDKIESKGIKSVRSRVTNIKEYVSDNISVNDFIDSLMESIVSQSDPSPLQLTDADLAAIQQLRDGKYATWEWIYGKSPNHAIEKYRRYPFGSVTLSMTVNLGGIIDDIQITGDFFGIEDISGLENLLIGAILKQSELMELLEMANVPAYIAGLDAAQLTELLLY